MDAANRNLWTASFRREQLIELLESRGPRPVRTDGIRWRTADDKHLLGVWYAEEETALAPLPQLLIADRQVLDDLFAWSASYLRAFGPLSSILRPMTPEQFEGALNRTPPRHPWKLAGGAIGLVVGEILSHGNDLGIDRAVAATPSSTLSFAILRAWYLGLPKRAIGEICDGYAQLFDQTHRLSSNPIWQAAEEVAVSLTGSDVISRVDRSLLQQSRRWMRELMSGANLYEVARQVLQQSTDVLSSQDAKRLEEMTAEARVKIFDKLAPALRRGEKSFDRIEASFALALAAFICRPGLEQQAGLLREHVVHMPEAWLWLGALQVLSPISDSLSLNFGAGWHIARELFRPEEPWTSTRADAAISEMNVLSLSKSRIWERLVGRQRLDVEIYPMISTAVRGLIAGPEQLQSDELGDRKYAAPRDSATSAKINLAETRIEEALGLLREARRNDLGSAPRPGRKRR